METVVGIVMFSLMLTGVIPNTSGYEGASLIGAIIGLSIVVFFSFITILMVRRAKAKGSSKDGQKSESKRQLQRLGFLIHHLWCLRW